MTTTSEYEIERASGLDFDELAQVWEASVAATHHFLRQEDFDLFKSMIREFFAQVDLAQAKDAGGRTLGFLGTLDGKVEMLFIHPDRRGTGVGKLLLRHAIDTLGVNKVDVNEQNAQAVGFYQHMGFRVVDRSDTDGMGKPYPILHLELGMPA